MNDTWPLVKTYLENYGLVKSQIDSFNVFISNLLPIIVEDLGYSDANEQWKVKFSNLKLTPPAHTENNGHTEKILPKESRLRNLSYSSNMYTDISIQRDDKLETFKHCFIGKMPIMVNSNYCNLDQESKMDTECLHDPGGYFIISGCEKVVIAQEKMNNNQVYTFKTKNEAKYTWQSEMRSLSENDTKSTSTIRVFLSSPNNDHKQFVRVQLPFLKQEIPAFVIFKYLEQEPSDLIEMYSKFGCNEIMRACEIECERVLNGEELLNYIGKRCIYKDTEEYIHQQMTINFLPHVGSSHKAKSKLFGYMIDQLLKCNYKIKPEDDRDHYKNKRVDTIGSLFSSLFRQLFKKMVKEFTNSILKLPNTSRVLNISSLLKSKIITNGLKFSLATGTWGVGGTHQNARTGVSQVLNRHSYMSMLSHLRRINSPIGKEGKLTQPRQLHGSHAYRICPSETPEGAACGLVKNMALTNMVTFGSSSEIIVEFLKEFDVAPEHSVATSRDTLVFVNGCIIGYHKNPNILVSKIKNIRSDGDISREVSIAYDIEQNEIRIHTDTGRCVRPLIIVKNGSLRITKQDIIDVETRKKTWNTLLNEQKIEYIDADEEETCTIAFSEKDLHERRDKLDFTHCELHPAMMLGITASNIPFAEHNQAPRVVYQSAMSKQAMGIYTSNHNERFDSIAHVLLYPQKPLVKTKIASTLNYDKLPSGINAVVAICCYSGYNQEDSIVMNKSAIDRGLFRSAFYRTFKEECHAVSGTHKESFENPHDNNCKSMKYANYNLLDEDGLICPGTKVTGNDILVGKVSGNGDKDLSVSMKPSEEGTVDKVMISTNEQGMSLVKTKVRSIRVPEIGDKFASVHAQKGTIGMTLNQEDMPFTEQGIVPDIIVNPHAIPSRMTIGQLIECIYGKKCALSGEYGDGTAFTNPDPSDIAKELKALGFNKHGEEIMFNGQTGQQMKTKIFIGPTYYQRLKHMVADKVHSRSTGPIQVLTRQPVEGRSREGGLRFGEMERDCMISHGASAFLKERLLDQSDTYETQVCKDCGMFAIHDVDKQNMYCNACNKADVFTVKMPYACKLLFQELYSMNITPRMNLT
jgi:DNA-directed RNA polymerase II subunit RPB2